MTKLTAENVQNTFFSTLFEEDEPHENYISVDGLVRRVCFHPERLESQRETLKEYLMQLPHEFREKEGGGWSFIYSTTTADGELWGEQYNAEQLIMMGIGLGLVEYAMPREFWKLLPGGVPYIVIKDIA